jgi:hypothetical protein
MRVLNDNSNYALVHWQNRDKLLLPISNGKLIKSGIEIHKSPSFKGKLFHSILRMESGLKILDWSALVKNGKPERFGDFKWNEWVQHALQVLNINDGWASFSFPQNEDRRFVALLLDSLGVIQGFAKVAMDDVSMKYFKNEVAGLNYFSRKEQKEFNVPNVIYEGYFEQRYYFIQSLIPTETKYYIYFKDRKWIDIINEIAFGNTSETVLHNQLWWKKLKTMSAPSVKLIPYIESKISSHIEVCNIHGDFGPGNILFSKDNYWVYDWEGFNKQGPILTDYFSFACEYFFNLTFLSKKFKVNKLLNYLFRNVPNANKCNIALAIAYLSTTRNWTLDDNLANELCNELLNS